MRCGKSYTTALCFRRDGVRKHVMFAPLLRTELPDGGLTMTVSLTFPLTANPKRFQLTMGERACA